MSKYQTIAVGTDGSASSLAAVRTAAEMAVAFNATLVAVCAHYQSTGSVLNTPQADASSIPVVNRESAVEYLAEAKAAAEAVGATEVKTHTEDGSPTEVLLDAIEEFKVDLLVVGNRGVNTLTGRVFGNIPTGVARRALVDVMLVNTEDVR